MNIEDIINKVHCADCLEFMPLIPNKSIDAIITDLPYQITNCHWDKLIPFEPLWKQYERITKPSSIIALTAGQPFTSKLVSSNFEMFRHEWIWMKDKSGNFMNLKFEPAKIHESVLVFGNKKGTYIPIMETRDEGNKRKNKPRLNFLQVFTISKI